MSDWTIKNLLPRSLYGRAALILLVPVITLLLVVSAAFIQRLYADVTEQMTQNASADLRLLLSTVEASETPNAAKEAIAPAASALGVETILPGQVQENAWRFTDLSARVIARTLSERITEIHGVDLSQNRLVSASMQTRHGVLEVTFSRRRVSASNPHQLLVWMAFTALLMTVIAYFFLRNQLRPIRRLAKAAEAFGKGQSVSYTPGGANEVRSAGQAFLSMRSRIERQIEQRTLMLSGVSHDLRTPLTRIKLGLSMQPQSEDTDALLSDVADMENLIEGFLNFASSSATEELQDTDIFELVEECVQNAKRAGIAVETEERGYRHARLKVRPFSLSRAIENLINNGAKYGSTAWVSVKLLDKAVRISVEDDGPGIPENLRHLAVKPFARLDEARGQNKGAGVGLGLAIVTDIMRGHGGSLRLGDSDAHGGLKVDLVLPR